MSKLNIFEEYADLFEAEDIDPKEYDYEGEMAKDQLVTMADAASELHDMLDDTENLPEWCQNKISKATDYIDTVRDYMLAKKTKAGGDELDDIEKDMKEYKELNPTKAVNKMANSLAKKVKSMKKNEDNVDEISVGMRNKYYDSAKKDIERAKSSAVGKILRGKEADGTRHDHSIELRRIKRREKGIKTAKDQAIKNIRRELYPKKKTNEAVANEISKKTVGNYIKKRTSDIAGAGGEMSGDFGIGPDDKKARRHRGVSNFVKYQRGTKRAVDKLTGKAKVPATENNDMYTKNTATKDKMAYKKDNQRNAPYKPTLEEWKKNLSESVYTEKLKVSDGMGAWVKDFQKSDAPQFKGKDNEERRDMAVAAYLSAKRGD